MRHNAECRNCGRTWLEDGPFGFMDHSFSSCDSYDPEEIGVFEQLGADIGKLTDEKQEAYGDSFGKAGQVMRILYPDGIAPEQMDDALAVVRVVDKLFRVATKKDAFGESPWRDIAGYGLLGAARAPVLLAGTMTAEHLSCK